MLGDVGVANILCEMSNPPAEMLGDVGVANMLCEMSNPPCRDVRCGRW